MSAEQTNDNMFQGLVISLAAAAMQHLGKTLNPVTHKIEKSLEAAQATIDMLDMLEAKTKGNLSDAESKLLKGVFLKGVGPEILWGEVAFLAAYALLVFVAATRKVGDKVA